MMSVNIKELIKPISYIKTNAAEMMKFVNEQHQPIIITQNGEAKAVLLDLESYQQMQAAFGLLNIFKLAEAEYEQGLGRSDSAVFDRLKEKYKA